mmetsp:Transcript_19154/g.23291  ORF Transcript_19154/g.23291 Transcript_19154/m.23291 type:complete len:111 (-) Transcript_19154:96-428(-)
MFNDLALHWREYQQMDKLNFREITPDDMCVVLYRDIWERFHDSYVYKNLSARCKREYSRKYVLEHLKQNLTLKQLFLLVALIKYCVHSLHNEHEDIAWSYAEAAFSFSLT